MTMSPGAAEAASAAASVASVRDRISKLNTITAEPAPKESKVISLVEGEDGTADAAEAVTVQGLYDYIMDAGKVAAAIAKMGALSVAVADPLLKALSGKCRKMTMTIFNETQFPLQFVDSYFGDGRFAQAPTNVKPFSTLSFSACDGDGTIMQGVTGAATFTLLQMTFTGPSISVGFRAPWLGTYKASAIWNSDPEKAYDATEEGTFKETKHFTGLTAPGQECKYAIDIVSCSAEMASITLTQCDGVCG